MRIMLLFVARHGETDMNVEQRAAGLTEAMLTENGIAQAKEMAEKLKKEQSQNQIKHILVSPLKRARDTARFTEEALGIKAVIEPRLHEINFGDYEGADWNMSHFGIKKREPFLRCPNGESYADAMCRAYTVIAEVQKKYAGENVLFVCHGGIGIGIHLCFTSQTLEEFANIWIANCEIRRYEIPEKPLPNFS